ncbi:MAG: dihydrofolate reductase [Oscillospiraceae bacterium]|nr:dihydrofolate reductase [Oscillospiraceae bacterium]
MDLIVAVYSDWGIGCDGTQPVALSADRKFFRETTRGAAVIAGRKTVADFPGQKPLPGRKNIVLTRQEIDIPGFTVCHSPEEAMRETQTDGRVFVIGGGSIYLQMLPFCENAYVTKLSACPKSDTYFPDLDEMPDWEMKEVLSEGEENGISFQMCLYRKKR